ncbi:major facilitator superfamily domain-containing protein [Rhypophila decipiens]|uniref:Major facilitator superfamily domain-containing protein n=1 Tax=Rhypophila decipiens TaxID=261697 RepID=A0AAN6Y0X9_9PEZI|nr:major facilitator superfamily domain-containing protein [Rhypophila decipiens]
MTRSKDKDGAQSSARGIAGLDAAPRPLEAPTGYGGGTETETTRLLGAGTRRSDSDGEHDTGVDDRWAGLDDFEGLSWRNKPSVFWLLFPYAIFTLAFGGSAVPKVNLMVDLVCGRYFSDRLEEDPNFIFTPVVLGDDNPQCRHNKDVLQGVAALTLVVNVTIGILSSLTAPKIGALSDRYGRRRLLVLCSMGGIMAEIITILAATFPTVIHYRWLILGAFFDGLTGSFTAGSVLSHSYTSDCTPPSKRGLAIGYLHSCLFAGLALGPLISGYFVKWMGSLISIFYVTLGCHIFFVLFIAFIIPESLSKKRQLLAREKYEAKKQNLGPASLKTTNPLAPLEILFPRGPENRRLRRNLITLALLDTAIIGAAMSAGSVTILYTQDTFNWGNLESSQFISGVSMVRVIVLLGIFPVINYIFRIRPEARRRRESGVALVEKNSGADKLDIWIIRIALLSDVIGVTGYIFVRTSALFVICAVFTAFGGLGSATIQSALSKHVPSESVGQLLGAIGLMHASSRIVFPVIFNALYYATVKIYPQAFFVLLTAIFGVCMLASWLIRPHVYMKESYESAPASSSEDARLLATAGAQARLENEEILPII